MLLTFLVVYLDRLVRPGGAFLNIVVVLLGLGVMLVVLLCLGVVGLGGIVVVEASPQRRSQRRGPIRLERTVVVG